MYALRSTPIDRAWRTFTWPSAPVSLEMTNASDTNNGQWYTFTFELALNWSSVVSGCGYVPVISFVSRPDVRLESSGTPLKTTDEALGLSAVSQYASLRSAVSALPGFHDASLNGPVHIVPPEGVPNFLPFDST